ncbi:N-acetyltransferase [Streptomyces sp. ISL-66]|uniref:N-acetyltransferase n=1 Tax=Streptomyces sp. ISL-66 TaxID=2819186 RepID=UPI001BE6F197|nr:N-acetyltransferase [Streptomyces sp. ISL-66]MBT2470600.1 N-acetyltransferase [Streptomyces sp. ISL-66]
MHGDTSPGEECLLLVHIRKVVGQAHYRVCTHCAEAVITGVVIEERFLGTGLGTRTLSHLRSRYPDMTWRTTLDLRTTRDLLRRMRIPVTTPDGLCSHMRQPLSDPVRAGF